MQRTDGTHGHPTLGTENERALLAHQACVGHVFSHSLLFASVRSLHSGCASTNGSSKRWTSVVPYVLSLLNPPLASISTRQLLSRCCSYHQNMFQIPINVSHKPMQCIKWKGWGMDVRATLSSHPTDSLAYGMVPLGSFILECLHCDRCPSTKHRVFDAPNFAKTAITPP